MGILPPTRLQIPNCCNQGDYTQNHSVMRVIQINNR